MYWSYFWLGQNREGFWESVGLQETIVSKYGDLIIYSDVSSAFPGVTTRWMQLQK